ncbi:MAG: cyclic nucleotide-binding domain-containing protein [Chitinispirillaceae bacterium]|nr:cyclic nucleotide-binding domain-containing protein [Chitinispirillaceae bacterium]
MKRAQKRHIVSFEPGDYLFKQHEMTRDLYILKKGTVRIFKMEGAVEIDLDTVGPGNVVGEVASIDGGPRTASGVALEPCEALVIPAAEFQSILTSVPQWFQKIAMILVQRLREVDARISRSIEGERTNHIAAIISLLAFTEHCVSCPEGFVIDRKTIEHQIIDLLDIPLGEITSSLERLHKLNYLRLERSGVILSSRESLDGLAEKVFHATTTAPAT